MCGRYTISAPNESWAEEYQLQGQMNLKPRFNIAPSQEVPVIRGGKVENLRWGLIPSWAKDKTVGYKMINARAETLSEKPAFKKLFRTQRCLVIADGFYEWKSVGAKKRPYYIFLKNHKPFAFAGLWDRWKSPEGELIESFAIVTTEANEKIRIIHDRMPVILRKKNYKEWLEISSDHVHELSKLLKPIEADLVDLYPVSTLVNKPTNDDSSCITEESAASTPGSSQS